MRRLGHRPELDGLRGAAALVVVLAHAHIRFFADGGLVAVEVFFVLSGFLITALLLEERDRTSTIGLPAFYGRRIRRLVPALAAFTLAMAVFTAFGLLDAPMVGVVGALTYTTNVWQSTGLDVGIFDHLWSLAVEEHFYLVWPVVVWLARGRDRRVAWIAALGATASVLLRWSMLDDPVLAYHSTLTRVAGLLIGGGLAVAYRRGLRPPVFHIGCALLASQVITGSYAQTNLHRLGLLLVDVGAAAVLLGAPATRFHLGLASRPMRWLGSISYPLYLWQAPVCLLTLGWPAVALSLIAAQLSTTFVEKRFRRPRPPAALADPTAAIPAVPVES